MRDVVHMQPSEGPCETHDWLTEGMAKRLLAAMRERHGKGGVNVCRECIDRAKEDADRKRGLRP